MSDLAEIFAKDPLKLTISDEEYDLIIARYREARNQHNLGVRAAGSTKKVKAEQPKITNLDDLLGEII